MDRNINIRVGGNFISKDSRNAGVSGEGNVAMLRIEFDESWDGYAKTVTFWDAHGKNPVKRTLTVDYIVNIQENPRLYLVPIPPEPMTEAGVMSFVIDGYEEGRRQRSIEGKLEVKYAPMEDNAGEPTDPTPTQSEQLQLQIDALITNIQGAYEARDEAAQVAVKVRAYATSAELSANKAERAVGRTSYIGENGNWYAWNGEIEEWYDTGVRAQSGSTVYVGDNPSEDADVWIDPDGEIVEYATKADLLDLANKVAPSPASITIYADRWEQDEGETMWHQEVVVANAPITPYSKVDIQLSAEQIAIFYEKDLAFVTENDGGKVTVYSIGRVPENDYILQATVSEVVLNG
mgnify:CR=1 FL=1